MQTSYYVVSNGDEPCRIFFTFEEAKASGALFIDVFNEQGLWVKAYKFVDSDGENNFYSNTF
jgi:hypothetical protein